MPDPCLEHIIEDDPTRSTTYIYDGSERPDFLMEPGWYRMTSGAGGDMAMAPPGVVACNALAQIWMNGELGWVNLK